MRASSGAGGRREERIELPAVLAAGEAKQWVEEALARRWQAASSVRLRLPPSWMGVPPGELIQLPDRPQPMTVRSATIAGMVVTVEAEPAPPDVEPLPADPGRAITEFDLPVGASELALFELPSASAASGQGVSVMASASNQGKWKPLPVMLRIGADPLPPILLPRRAVLGKTETLLAGRVPAILDLLSSVTVRLANEDQLLLNADADALMAGANLAIVGEELIQFGRAEQLAPGRFRLSKLLRGRRGTEWAASTHVAGERFCLVDGAAMRTVELSAAAVGGTLVATAQGVGDRAPLPEVQRLLGGESMRPPPVCHLELHREGAVIRASWVRRSLRGWAWSDGVGDANDSFPERYRATLSGPAGELAIETDAPEASFAIATVPAAPGDDVQLAVRTIGPMALSRGTAMNFTL